MVVVGMSIYDQQYIDSLGFELKMVTVGEVKEITDELSA
jgi:hypothetical protein